MKSERNLSNIQINTQTNTHIYTHIRIHTITVNGKKEGVELINYLWKLYQQSTSAKKS